MINIYSKHFMYCIGGGDDLGYLDRKIYEKIKL